MWLPPPLTRRCDVSGDSRVVGGGWRSVTPVGSWPHRYIPTTAIQSKLATGIFAALLKKKLPTLARHLEKLEADVLTYAQATHTQPQNPQRVHTCACAKKGRERQQEDYRARSRRCCQPPQGAVGHWGLTRFEEGGCYGQTGWQAGVVGFLGRVPLVKTCPTPPPG